MHFRIIKNAPEKFGCRILQVFKYAFKYNMQLYLIWKLTSNFRNQTYLGNKRSTFLQHMSSYIKGLKKFTIESDI